LLANKITDPQGIVTGSANIGTFRLPYIDKKQRCAGGREKAVLHRTKTYQGEYKQACHAAQGQPAMPDRAGHHRAISPVENSVVGVLFASARRGFEQQGAQ
jgi:hypothetical protein